MPHFCVTCIFISKVDTMNQSQEHQTTRENISISYIPYSAITLTMSEEGLQDDEKPCLLSLGLEDDEDDDKPRRFLHLPSGHLLAYGGESGNVSCLLPEQESTENSTSNKFVIVQQYDDEVRSIAVSQDGKRLAVGFDTGSTQIYTFDQNTDDELLVLHPYVQAIEKIKSAEEKKNDDDLMSQDCGIVDNSSYFIGPDLGAPIRDLVFLPQTSDSDDDTSSSSSSYLLAIASEAGMCVIDVTSQDIMTGSERLLEQESKEFHDHCGIRGLAASVVNSKTTVLASLAMDGRMCLWDVTKMKLLKREEQICVPKKDVGEIHNADAYDRSCRPVIYNEQNTTDIIIGTPGKLTPCLRVLDSNLNLQLVDDSSFDLIPEEETGHIQSIVSILTFSDRLLVTSGRDGRVQVWEGQNSSDGRTTKQWKVVEKFQLKSPATDLFIQQNQTNKEKLSLFSACANGSLQVLDISKHRSLLRNSSTKIVESRKISKTAISSYDDLAGDNEESTASAIDTTSNIIDGKDQSQKSSQSSKRILKKSDDKDEEDDDSVDFSFNEESSGALKKNVHFLDEADDDDDDDDEDQDKAKVNSTSAAVSGNGVTDFDDDSVASEQSFMVEDPNRRTYIHNPIRTMDVVKPQPAFSPSSTPLDLARRFLCWNHIGSVSILQGDDHRNTIDINFTESAVRRPFTFTDNLNFIIGSLGESGGIFASDIQDDDILDGEDIDGLDDLNMSERTKQAVRRDQRKHVKGSDISRPTGSSIFFYRFADTLNITKNKDWHLILPDGERALGAACGDGWSAVMTSRRFLRLFSSGGNQNQLIWLKGEPVTIVGRGRLLAVFYHESSPLADKTQQLGYTLWDAKDFRVISRGSVSCLSKGSSISWVGFNNDFSLVVMDSDGMLSMLVAAGQGDDVGNLFWEWVPVLDTIGLRKSTDDNHWPITVYDGKLVCIPLKGGNTYPDASRRPVTTTLGLRMPLARSVLSKNSALEELSVRSNIALAQKKFVNENELDCDVDCEANELEKEYNAMCRQVDKITIKLFAAMVEAGKYDGALELVSRLHSKKSYDIAMRYADRHNNKLAAEIEIEMKFKFGEEDDGYDVNGDVGFSNTFMKRCDDVQSKQISPDSGRSQKRSIKLNEPTGFESKKHRVK